MHIKAKNAEKMGFVSKTARWIVFFLILVVAAPVDLPAQERPDAGSDWQYSVAPYVWFVSLEGDVTAKGQTNDIDVGFSDIWDELNLGATIEFEAWKDRYGYFVSVMYGNVGDERTVGGIKIVPTIENFWAEVGGFYRLGTWDLNKDSTQKYPTVTVDSYLGLRYSYVEVELDFRNVPVADAKGDRDWFEPVLGFRTLWDLSDSWSLSLGGDIGGMAFGSDFAWNAFGLIGYRFTLFGNDNAQFFAGYRALSQDYEDGSGAKKFEWDVTLHGPVIGLNIPFGGKKAMAAESPKDSDGDGIYDDMDRCPGTPAGVSVDRAGCPLDSDNDDVPDHLDKCPGTPKGVTVDGTGCPLDSDGDGVNDSLDQCPDTPRGATVNERGCWAFGGNMFFDFDKSEIKSEAYPLLEEAVNILEENPEMRVEIQGHTDSKGPEVYNQLLSEKRATAVKAYLVKQGIDSGRLEDKGYGESNPIASNDTEAGRQKNRRVQFLRIR